MRIAIALLLAPIGALAAGSPHTNDDPVQDQLRRLDETAFEALLEQWDLDKDQSLSTEELGPTKRAFLQQVDRNGDGQIDLAEFIAIRETERAKLGSPMPEPEHVNVSYGPHKRNTLDLWLAPSDKPTPLVLYIHGGGFKNGSKQLATMKERAGIAKCFRNQTSFAAINYRYSSDTTLDQIMADGARAVQFLRLHAERYNLDKTRFAAYGQSAGGGIALWLGTHDDLADPLSKDPVLTQSSRLAAAGHMDSQASYDFERWAEVFGIPVALVHMGAGQFLPYYGVETAADLDSPAAKKVRLAVDIPAFFGPEDCPVFLQNLRPMEPPTTVASMLHHPKHALWLKQHCDQVGVVAELVLADTAAEDRISVIDFFLARFEEIEIAVSKE